MVDLEVVNLPRVFSTEVRANGKPDGGDWARSVSTTMFVYAEFLARQNLLRDIKTIQRNNNLIIMESQLTEVGAIFHDEHYLKWLQSVDTTGMPEEKKRLKLERRWTRFLKGHPGLA